MSEQVKFEEEEVLVDQASQISRQSAITNLVVKFGLAKSESQATYVLIGIMTFCIATTLFVVAKYLI